MNSRTTITAVLILLTSMQFVRAENNTVTVYVAASATDVVTDLARHFEQSHDIEVRLSFAASSTMAKQIAAGAPADLYISANRQWMDFMEKKGLIHNETRCDMAGNRLVLIAPADRSVEIEWSRGFPFHNQFDGRLALADPEHAPAGMYAQQSLIALGWWDSIADRLAPAADVRAALRLVETGQCNLGMVMATDAHSSAKVTVVGTIPEHLHQPIRYPAALCRGASTPAADLLDYMTGPEAQAIWQRHGFTPISSTAAQAIAAEPSPDKLPASAPLAAESAEVWPVIYLSIKVAGLCVALLVVPGIACGYLLARRNFPGKQLFDALIHAPLVVPPVVTGYLALVLLGRQSAVGQFVEQVLGIDLAFTWLGAVLASACMGFPLMVRSVRLAVEMVNPHLEQAASVLGANPIRVFATVTLPLALPGIFNGMILAFARSLGEFGATITFAGNILGETRTLPLAVYTWLQQPGGESAAMKLVGLSLLLSLGALLASELLARRVRVRLGVA